MRQQHHPPGRSGRRVATALLVGLALVAASCGGDDDDSSDDTEVTDAPDDGDDTETTDAPDDGDDTEVTDAPDDGDDTETTDAPDDGDDTETTDAPEPAGDPEPGPGFDGETITVGVITDLSGPAAIIGVQLANGQQVYFDYLNAEVGGIAGKYPIEIELADSRYETSSTVQQYEKMKNDVVMISQLMGTPPTLAVLPLLEEDGLVAAPASQDSIWVREQHLMPVIEPYQIDVINGMSYYLNDGGGSTGDTICAIVQNDVYGEAGLEGLEFAAEQMGFEIATVTRYASGDAEFTAQVTELSNTDCAMVWATALPSEFAGILGTAAQMGFSPRWIAQSPSWVDELLALGEVLDNVWIASIGREWGDPDSEVATQIVDHIAKYRPEQEPDFYFLFGYMQAWAAHQVLDQAVAMGDLSREGVVAAMNSIDQLEFGDIAPPYGYGPPEDRDPPRGTTIFEIDADKPFGLGALASVISPEAEAYEFPTG